MKFLRPEIAWVALALLAGVALVRWRLRGRFSASTAVRWLQAPFYGAAWLRRLPLTAALAGLVLVGLSLMQPVLPYSEAEVQSRGLDIVMVLDLSSSMQEPMGFDVSLFGRMAAGGRGGLAEAASLGKTRLEATKDAIKAFVRGRRDDRIGLVVFSDHAYVVSPLTFDYDYLMHYIDMVDDRILQGEGKTAIGDGLALANHLLARQARTAPGGHQVVVVFTDGENNRGREPLDVLSESNDASVRVHLIGVDLEESVRSKPEVRRLLASVQRFGGQHFNATTENDLVAASRVIDAIEKGYLVNRVRVRDVPVYQWFALPALLCLATAAALRAVPYFVDQT